MYFSSVIRMVVDSAISETPPSPVRLLGAALGKLLDSQRHLGGRVPGSADLRYVSAPAVHEHPKVRYFCVRSEIGVGGAALQPAMTTHRRVW